MGTFNKPFTMDRQRGWLGAGLWRREQMFAAALYDLRPGKNVKKTANWSCKVNNLVHSL